MLSILISIVGILFTILFVIGIHEASHFLAARLLGVKVLCFSIGFGKTLWHRYDKSGTEYIIALVPLGGYVKMLDENESEVPPAQRRFAFNRQPFYKKFLIVLAGPIANILSALVLYWIIFVVGFSTLKPIIGEVKPESIAAKAGLQSKQLIVGVDNHDTQTWTSILFRIIAHAGDQDFLTLETKTLETKNLEAKKIPENKTQTHTLDLTHWQLNQLNPDPLSSIGITPYEPEIPLVVGKIAKASPAAEKLKLKDHIIALNHITIKDWDDLVSKIQAHPNQTVILTIKREQKILDIPITIGAKKEWLWKQYGYLGIGPNIVIPPDLIENIQYGPLTSIYYAAKEIYNFTYFNLLLFGKLITGKISFQSLGGPITIFESAGAALNTGWLAFLAFLAFLSISIGIINLLPIPGLDGGHLLFQIIETLIGRPIPESVLIFFYRLGFFLIFLLLIQALFNDILRL